MDTPPTVVAPVDVLAPVTPPAPAAAAAMDPGLAAAIADHTAKFRGDTTVPLPVAKAPEMPVDTLVTGKQDEPTPAATPAESTPDKSAEEAPKAEPEALQGQPKTEDEKPAEAKPVEQDEVAASIERYLRETRQARQERAKLAKERAAFQAEQQAKAKEMETLQRFQAAKAKDPVSAVEELLGDETMRGTFVLDLLERMKQREGDAPMTPERQAELAAQKALALVEAKLQEEREKAAQAQSAREAEQTARNKEAFYQGLKAEFEINSEKYPYLAASGVDIPEIDEAIQAHYRATGRPPTSEMIFRHFDQLREKQAQKLFGVIRKKNGVAPEPATAPAAKPVARAPVPSTVDSRGRPVAPSRPETVREQRDRIAAMLDSRR